MKIAMFGGTFDPFHLGHRHIIQSAIQEFGIDSLIVMPAGTPYHKAGRVITPATYRYEICRLSLERNSGLLLSDLEMKRDKASYTYDTIHELMELLPGHDHFYLLGGSDLLFTIDSWYRVGELLHEAALIIARRPDDDPQQVLEAARQLRQRYACEIHLLQSSQRPFSSTQIRVNRIRAEHKRYEERLGLILDYLATQPDMSLALESARRLASAAEPSAVHDHDKSQTDQNKGEAKAESENMIFHKGTAARTWKNALSPAAAAFIETHQLYLKEPLLLALKAETMDFLCHAERKLFTLLSRKRLIHSWDVLFTAVEMALRFHVDPDRCAIASLIHDCAKELSFDEACSVLPNCVESSYYRPALIHGPAGAELARRSFGITDPQIREAIYYHTTLRAGAGLTEKIVFLADKIEPGRDYADLAPIRKMSRKNLDAAVLYCLYGTRGHLIRTGLKSHPHSIAATKELENALPPDLLSRIKLNSKQADKR